jgi:hypothetical protein
MKLSKTMPEPQKVFTALDHPGNVGLDKQPTEENFVAMNPGSDDVPPELITLMVNEDGRHCPDHVFSMVQANYDNEPQTAFELSEVRSRLLPFGIFQGQFMHRIFNPGS